MRRRLDPAGIIMAAVLMGMLAAYLIWHYLAGIEMRGKEHWTAAVVATADIKPRTTISRDMITLMMFPRELLAADAVTDIKAVEGQVARDHIKPKEQVHASDLAPKGHVIDLSDGITSGMRAITIAANEIIGVATSVKPGNHVDILVTYHDPIYRQEITVPVLQNVRVLAVNRGATQPTEGEGASSSMTLEIPPEEGVLLAAADRAGALRVMLRAAGDVKTISTDPMSAEDFLGKQRRQILEALSGAETNRPHPARKAGRVITAIGGTTSREWTLE